MRSHGSGRRGFGSNAASVVGGGLAVELFEGAGEGAFAGVADHDGNVFDAQPGILHEIDGVFEADLVEGLLVGATLVLAE